MLLGDYFKNIQKNYKKIYFSGISFNSNHVKKNNIFFAIKGNKIDGNSFISSAIFNGAKIIVTEKKINGFKNKILFIQSNNIRKLLAEISFKINNKIPNNIITAVVEANKTRKNFVTQSILNKHPDTVGIYRLIMKEGSDNFRESAVLDILNDLKKKKIEVILYEPFINEALFNNIEVVPNLSSFISRSDLIIANRISDELKHVLNKVYSRDIFQEN